MKAENRHEWQKYMKSKKKMDKQQTKQNGEPFPAGQVMLLIVAHGPNVSLYLIYHGCQMLIFLVDYIGFVISTFRFILLANIMEIIHISMK